MQLQVFPRQQRGIPAQQAHRTRTQYMVQQNSSHQQLPWALPCSRSQHSRRTTDPTLLACPRHACWAVQEPPEAPAWQHKAPRIRLTDRQSRRCTQQNAWQFPAQGSMRASSSVLCHDAASHCGTCTRLRMLVRDSRFSPDSFENTCCALRGPASAAIHARTW